MGSFFWTYIYADDVALFVAPIKEDIRNLEAILQSFGEVTVLCTNFQKLSGAYYMCQHQPQ
jgi:hypothetical protein